MQIRKAAVAGQFYPSSPSVLKDTILGHLREAADHHFIPKVLIVPHAGLMYSGNVAGSAYKQIYNKAPFVRRVVLLGPSHHVNFKGLALPRCTGFSSPLGTIPLATEVFGSLLELTQIQQSDAIHQPEHALELQLPFLQTCLTDFKLIPLITGRTTPDQVTEVLECIWGERETLIIISSDLSHYHTYDQACAMDSQTVHEIEQFNTSLTGDQACGHHPINGLLQIARKKNLSVRTLDVKNSGDTAGDKLQVVGYGAFALQ